MFHEKLPKSGSSLSNYFSMENIRAIRELCMEIISSLKSIQKLNERQSKPTWTVVYRFDDSKIHHLHNPLIDHNFHVQSHGHEHRDHVADD